jgi:predicted nucleic acid-binding protein
MSLAAYPNRLPTTAVIERLAAAASHPSHEFWADDCSLLDPNTMRAERVHGPKQVTDLYLLALAVKHQGQLATFNGTIPLSAVPGAAKRHLAAL